jgi:hypothetical protein
MTRVNVESPVSLDSLDDHLKALLRLKIREFLHMSPWFRNIPSIDPVMYAGCHDDHFPALSFDPTCPHKAQSHQPHHARRHVRTPVVHAANSIF